MGGQTFNKSPRLPKMEIAGIKKKDRQKYVIA
jgi:hypothetical protein